MKAVIMAGGFGTRLRPLTCNLPKPMVPMVNRPMMEHIVELIKSHGVTDALNMLYFIPEEIQRYFQDGKKFGIKMKYLLPSADFGTAGCVKFAEKDLTDTFMVVSGDVLTDFDLTAALEFHRKKKALATMVLTRAPNPLQYGVVIINEENKITRFLEKPSWGEVFSDTINTGLYILEPEVLEQIPAAAERRCRAHSGRAAGQACAPHKRRLGVLADVAGVRAGVCADVWLRAD
jgi:mannose-1-phosphate guanylyltransferase/phosphomannomutase